MTLRPSLEENFFCIIKRKCSPLPIMSVRIAHLADIQVRYGKRHDEFKTVFRRTCEDLLKQKPDRIVVAGDIFHDKVKLSPSSIELVSKFLFDLSDIAPTDVILGNHDLNLKQLEQGDALTPIFEIARMLGREDRAVVVSEDNKGAMDFNRKAIYYYPNSGFFDVSNKLVYGIFSCKDNKMITLKDKDDSLSYVALWHGTLYGSKMDNGYDAMGEDLVNLKTFKGFDAVLMGDIHEHQTFDRDHSLEVDDGSVKKYIQNGWETAGKSSDGRTPIKKRIPSAAYVGSLCQQGFGESLSKGYLLWTIDGQDVSFERRHIANDHGFCKMTITRGENIEDRLDNLKFSANKRKTKVHIVYEDYEESYSIEKLNQIKQAVKDRHGCESVHVEFHELERETFNPDEANKDDIDPEDLEAMFNLFLDENEFDIDGDEERKEVIDFALKIEKELGIPRSHIGGRRWTPVSFVVSNLFSFPIEPTTIRWDQLRGITGVFGENYCGKSNLLRAMAWGWFQHIIGGAHAKYLINVYTSSDKGYTQAVIDIDGIHYKITREVHKGKTGNSYPTKFEVFREAMNSDGVMEYKWCSTLSDNTTADNTEVKRMITEALGTYDDFAKVSMHTQDGSEGYLNLEQQEKNDLIARYLNLYSYRDRHEYIKKPYNELRAKQKLLGESVDIELDVKALQLQISDKEKVSATLEEEKKMWMQKQDDAQAKILELTRNIQKIEETGYDSKEELQQDISVCNTSIASLSAEVAGMEKWLGTNVMKELKVDPKRTSAIMEAELSELRRKFAIDKEKYLLTKEWLAANPKKDIPVFDVSTVEKHIEALNVKMHEYRNKKSIFMGKDCPTCHQSIQKADPKGVNEMDALIIEGNAAVTRHRASIEQHRSLLDWNKKVDEQHLFLENLESLLRSSSVTINAIKQEVSNFNESKEFIELNKIIEKKNVEFKAMKTSLELRQRDLSKLNEKLARYDLVISTKAHNEVLEKDIDLLQSMVQTYKLSIHAQHTQIVSAASDMRVLANSLEDKKKRLNEVKSGDKMYKLYSIYLQAVERSGIPAMVIKRRLPMINNKVNSILQTIVDFKMEFSIDMKGNITELFFNTVSKWDSLPLSLGSGAQRFITSIAIKDALNYISKRSIVQPAIIMIDEGFGTLGEELQENIMIMLEYLKSKYQNVIIITHLNQVKEGADHIIEAVRDRSVIASEMHERDDKAGVSRLFVRR